MNKIERRMNIVAPVAAHVRISAQIPRAYAIASFDDKTSPKTQRALREMLRSGVVKYYAESVFLRNDGKGNQYGLLVYSDLEERAACFALLAAQA